MPHKLRRLKYLSQRLKAEQDAWEEAGHKFEQTVTGVPIKLNVGGHRFETGLATLTSQKGSFFERMFSGRVEIPCCDDDGSFFIDRNGTNFLIILDFMRGVQPDLESLPKSVIVALQKEADHYDLDYLISMIEAFLAPPTPTKDEKVDYKDEKAAKKDEEVDLRQAGLTPTPARFTFGDGYSLNKTCRIATKIAASGSWTAVLGPEVKTGVITTVKLVQASTRSYVMVGLQELHVNATPEGGPYRGRYLLYSSGGYIFEDGQSKSYLNRTVSASSSVGVLVEGTGDVYFLIDGVKQETAFCISANKKYRLVVLMHDANDQVEILE